LPPFYGTFLPAVTGSTEIIFTRESSDYFQRVLAIAILSVCPSVTRVDQLKTMQTRITKFSPNFRLLGRL